MIISTLIVNNKIERLSREIEGISKNQIEITITQLKTQ